MKIRILKEGSFTDALDQMVGSDGISGSEEETVTLPPRGARRRPSPVSNMQRKKRHEIILEKNGYDIENMVELGSGMFGHVFKTTDPSGREVAIKVMSETGSSPEAVQREMENYATVQDARKQSDLVAKHFPKVFAMFKEGGFGFISMELLTNKGGRMSLIGDIFQGIEGLVAPTGDSIAQGAYKDVRRRMYTYLTNDTSRNRIIDMLLDNVPTEIVDEIKADLSHLPYLQHGSLEDNANPRLEKSLISKVNDVLLFTAQDAVLGEFGNLKKEFASNPGLLIFLLKLLEGLREKDMQLYYMKNVGISMSWIDFIRKGSPIGIHNRPEISRADRAGADPEIGDAIGEAKSIRAALEELEKLTGLAGRDMHERNVMIREYTGDIVIVDLGLFKPRSEVVEEKKKRKKRKKRRKKRRSPRRAVYWGGYGYHDHSDSGGDYGGDGGGGDGKRDDKKKIKIKIVKNLEEKCQKGYKTHPKRKTKKMFGKQYRNCIKAEEGKENKSIEEKQK